MKTKNLQRLMALNLKPEQLAEVLSVLAEELKSTETRRDFDRKRKAAERAAKEAKKMPKTDTVLIKGGSPQWAAWEKHLGKRLPQTMSNTWQVDSEWPPGSPQIGIVSVNAK